MTELKIDEYGQVVNCADSALWVSWAVLGGNPVAFSLSLGNMTRFEMSFVPLRICVPAGVSYEDGSGLGIQINIDRHLSYSLPIGSEMGEEGYLATKWGLMRGDALVLLPFFNTVITGRDCYGG